MQTYKNVSILQLKMAGMMHILTTDFKIEKNTLSSWLQGLSSGPWYWHWEIKSPLWASSKQKMRLERNSVSKLISTDLRGYWGFPGLDIIISGKKDDKIWTIPLRSSDDGIAWTWWNFTSQNFECCALPSAIHSKEPKALRRKRKVRHKYEV